MNTQMAEAFKSAGVKAKSLSERVWLYVKDHPESNSRQLESVYGTSAAQALSDMYTRGMLDRKRVKTRDRGGMERHVWVYSVTTDEYEAVPRPPKPKAGKKVEAEVAEALKVTGLGHLSLLNPPKPPTGPVTGAAPIQPTPKQVDFAAYVDSLTVAEARKLYLHLKQLFA